MTLSTHLTIGDGRENADTSAQANGQAGLLEPYTGRVLTHAGLPQRVCGPANSGRTRGQRDRS